MTGTKYIMGKDRPPLTPPAPTKVCKRCNIEKPNNFLFFGKKCAQTRNNFVTVDVCKDCAFKKLQDTMAENTRKKNEYETMKKSQNDQFLTNLINKRGTGNS